MTKRILCVDDVPNVLKALRRCLVGEFDIEVATGPEQALAAIDADGKFAVCLTDMRMPGMNGVELLRILRDRSPSTVRMMLTGNADVETAIQAVNEGEIFRFMTKPCPPDMLKAALRAGLEQNRLVLAERELLEETLNGCVNVLVEILSLVAPTSFGWCSSAKETAGEVARKLGLKKPWEAEVAFMLSQLGLVTLPPDMLARFQESKPLTPEESVLLDRVPEIGANLIASIPRMESVAEIIRMQREDHDPTQQTDETRTIAQILRAILDHNKLVVGGARHAEALTLLARRTGAFDPRVLKALSSVRMPSMSQSQDSEGFPPIAIEFNKLRPGHVLAAPIETLDGRCVVREGHRVGHVLLERLRNHDRAAGLREPLYVVDPRIHYGDVA